MLRSTKFLKRTGVVSENTFLQMKDNAIDFVRDLTIYSKNQLRFKLSQRSEPQLYCDFNEDYYYMVACVDSNQDYDKKPPKNIYACCANVQCKAFAFKDKPRYICRGRCSSNGKKYMLEIADKYTVVVRATDVLQLYDFLRSLCCDCLYPKFNCCCQDFDDEITCYWNICNSKTGKLQRENDNELVLTAYRVLPQSSLLPQETKQMLFFLENLLYYFRNVQRSHTPLELTEHTLALVRSITGESIVTMSVEYFLKLDEFMQLQDDKWYETLENVYLHYDKLKDTTLGRRYIRMFSHTVAHLIYYKMGLKVNATMYDQFEREKYPTAWECMTFVDAIIGVITITIKVGAQSIASGTMLPFFVDGTSVGDWHTRLMMAMAEYEAVNCPEVYGKTSTEIVNTLDNIIDEGTLLMKSSIHELAKANISRLLGAAVIKRTKQKVLNATSRIRKSPFGIIIYGPPGIGKTDVMSVLRVSLSSALNYDPSQDNVYIHEGSSDHYDGYTESKAVVIVDDAAQLLFNSSQPDQGVIDLIKMDNSVPFNMPMAELSEKGKVPFRPSLLMISTNVRDLNINLIFSSPFAVMRRFIHITVELKDEYKDEKGLLKPNVDVTNSQELYCPYWNFIISTPYKPNDGRDPQRDANRAVWRETYKFDSWGKLLEWIIPLAIEHNEKQTWFVKRNQMINAMCEECKFPVKFCKCNVIEQSLFSSKSYSNLKLAPSMWESYKSTMVFKFQYDSYEVGNAYDILHELSEFATLSLNEDELQEYVLQELVSSYIVSVSSFNRDKIEEDFPKFLEWYKYHSLQDRELTYAEIACEPKVKLKGFTDRIFRFFVKFGITCYFQYRLVRASVWYLKDFAVTRFFVKEYVYPYIFDINIRKQIFYEAGQAFKQTWFFKNKWYVMMFGFGSLLGFYGTKQLISKMFLSEDKTERSVMQSLSDYVVSPKPCEEKEKHNVWQYANEGLTSANFKPTGFASLDQLDTAIVTNMVIIEIKTKEYSDTTRGLILGTDAILVNKHIRQDGKMKMKLTFMSRKQSRIESTIDIDPSQFVDMPDRDISIILTKSIPLIVTNLRRSLYNALPEGEVSGHMDGYYLIKQADGDVVKHRVYNITKSKFQDHHCTINEAWKCFSKMPTNNGECGSLLFADTKRGPLLLGIHSALDMDKKDGGYYMFASPILNSDYDYSSGCSVGVITEVEYQKKTTCFLDYQVDPTIVYHGELKTHNIRYKSSVVKTSIHDYVIKREGFGDFYTAPPMHRWKPQQLSLKEIVTPVVNFDEKALLLAAENFYVYLDINLPDTELKLLEVYDYETAVNGVPGINYVDAINRQTSMGYPYKTSKMKYLDIVDGKGYFKKEIKEAIELALVKMEEGVRPHCIFSANLKDEPISHKKAELNKVRVFYSCPVTLLIIVRMFLASFCRVVQRNRRLFKCAVGMSHFSLEWGELYKCLTRFNKDHFIAGDYAFFDKRMHFVILRYAFLVIKKLCKKAGYSDEEMNVLDVIEGEVCNPCVDYFGSNFTFLSSEVSGHQMTTILNCFVNVLYLSYAFIKCGYDVKDFFENVELVVLGDDHVVGVNSGYDNFNHTNISNVFEFLGVGYTMADKESASIPFIPISEVTFLKRKFCIDEVTGYILAPLELKSLCRTLTYQVESKVVHKEYQLYQSMVSTLMDSFMYGEVFFKEWKEFLLNAPHSTEMEIYLNSQPFKDYEYYLDLFLGRAAVMGRSQNITSDVSYCEFNEDLPLYNSRVEYQSLATRAFPKVPFQGWDWLPPDQRSAGINNELKICPKINLLANYNNNQKSTSNDYNKDIEDKIMSEADPIAETIAVDQETFKFVNEKPQTPIDISTDLDMVASNEVVSTTLASYLKRPAKIASYTWSENEAGAFKVNYKPWTLFFSIPAIKNKILNYALMRCKLHVKFTINASQFYYGSLAAVYTPGYGDTVYDRAGRTLSYDAGYQVLTSQKPHVWLDPQRTSTEEIVLPFVYPKDFVNLSTAATLDNLGQIDLVQYAQLRSANGVSTAGVTVIVYAWADDIEISGNTSSVVLQSKREQGPVGRVCSTAKSIASKLSDVPIIGEYAKATETVSGAIGSVADFFGFTNVPNTSDVQPYKPLAFHTLASSSISEPINKLSLQPDQEISVSTKHDGIDEGDPLTIQSLVGRESFLTGSLWATTSAENVILFTSFVTPNLYAYDTVTMPKTYGTPMHHFSQFFENWRGDIIFKIKVIKSKYHRGRINIAWDPNVKNLANMPNNGDPSVYNVVMDLEETDEVELRVPWMQAEPFNKVSHTITTPFWSNGTVPAGTMSSSNGTLQVRVINRLTAPEATSDVDILVFVRGAENLEFSVPFALKKGVSFLKYQADRVYHVDLTNGKDKSERYTEMIGERIISIRELLHRQSMSKCQVIPKNRDFSGDTQFIHYPIKRLPQWFGFDTTGNESARNLANDNYINFNWVCMHPLNWTVACFLGYKGSTNWTVNVVREAIGDADYEHSTVGVGHASIGRMTVISNSDRTPFTFAMANTSSTSLRMQLMNGDDQSNYRNLGDAQSGLALTNQLTQAGLSANLPYYCSSKFLYTYPVNYYANSAAIMNIDDQNNDWFKFTTVRTIKNGTIDSNLYTQFYCGTGPDFNVVFFICVPVVFSYTPTPNPAEI